MKRLQILVFLLIAVFGAGNLYAQKKVYVTKKINPTPPVVDGVLDDPTWQIVPWADDFTQVRPVDNGAPSEKTAFKILYDDSNLYVAIRAFEADPDDIVSRIARRDDQEADYVGVALDSYFDQRTGFYFSVTPAGVKIDGMISDNGVVWDSSYDPVWFAGVSRDEEGWTAEMRIPFSQLRFAEKEEQVWGLNVSRDIFRFAETDKWPYIPENAPGKVYLFGELRGIKGIKPPRRVELLPYSVGKIERFEEVKGNPFATGSDNSIALGLDGKIGITSNLTLDLTVNPDFGQVEADPSEVNLTTYETFFEEKRPFFIEGKNIFEFKDMGGGRNANDGLFYSRRIGRNPQLSPYVGDNEYSDAPNNTSIISALKLTGKTSRGWSVGIIEAVTQEEKAKIYAGGETRKEIVEPMTNYFVGRLKRDYDGGNTIIGAMATATNRKLMDSNRDFLPDAAFTGGVDFLHQWQDKTYYVKFKGMVSNVHGTEEAMQVLQSLPTHYFQRPDADYITFDSTRTSLSGHGGMFQIGKGGNGNWTFSSTTYWRSPGIHLDDVGYLREDDKFIQKGEAMYKIWNPFLVFRTFSVSLKRYFNFNFDWELVNDGWFSTTEAEFKNYWKLYFETRHAPPELKLRELRGGPMLLVPTQHNYVVKIDTDIRKKSYIKFEDTFIKKDDGFSIDNKLSADIIWRPANNIMVSAKPFYNIFKQDLQYVCTQNYMNDKRYIMARIDQETFGVTCRFNYSITPDLTIQYYGQPFVSAGSYERFKRITDPRAGSYHDRFSEYSGNNIAYDTGTAEYTVDEDNNGTDDYTFSDPDFNVREFRSNLVLRWEYKPGSVAYLVWTQDRAGHTQNGDFSIDSEMRELFDIHPYNIFLLKMSYWFSLQ